MHQDLKPCHEKTCLEHFYQVYLATETSKSFEMLFVPVCSMAQFRSSAFCLSIHPASAEEIRCIFDDNSKIIFVKSS